jgi:DNA-binding MarR family transcriptional regulator
MRHRLQIGPELSLALEMLAFKKQSTSKHDHAINGPSTLLTWDSEMKRRASISTGIRFDLDQRSMYRFWIMVTQLQECLEEFYLARFGRPSNAWRILSVIGHYETTTPSDVAVHTHLDRDKVARVIDSLNKQGLINRRQNSRDRRRALLTLTAKGKRVYDEMESLRRRIEIEFLGVLKLEQRVTLYQLLDILQARARDLFSGKQAWKKFHPDYAAHNRG